MGLDTGHNYFKSCIPQLYSNYSINISETNKGAKYIPYEQLVLKQHSIDSYVGLNCLLQCFKTLVLSK